ncbi:MAG: Endonuclease NucS, partial [uncultured Friedmanniella sp.]
ASRHRPLPGRLRRPADRPPADGHAAHPGQGGRLRLGARRRPRLQAPELDEPAVRAGRAAGASTGRGRGARPGAADRAVGGAGPRRGHPADLDRRGAARLLPRARRRPGPAEGRRRGAPAGPAGRAPGDLRAGLVAGAARAHDRHRSRRPALPRRLWPLRGRGGQAARGDRRGGAADPLPRADAPGPPARRGPGRLRRPADQAPGPGARRRPGDHLRDGRLRRAAGHGQRRRPAVL